MRIGFIFVGLILGIGLGYLYKKRSDKKLRKNARNKIEKQNLKFKVDGKDYDFAKEIKKNEIK